MSEKSCLPIDPKDTTLNEELLKVMPRMLIEEFRAFVFEKGDKPKAAAVNPKSQALRQYLTKKLGKNIEWFKATEEDVTFILKNCKKDFKADILHLTSTANESNNNISRAVDDIINYAFAEGASDIHIEPKRDEILVRFRLDGVLHTVCKLTKQVQPALIARFKILANLKIDEHLHPQDGRIEPEASPEISLRISIVPTIFGEKVALRVLDDTSKNISVHNLGLSDQQRDIIMENIEKPYGMIIASGPTGSGKTTTLYAILQLLKKEGLNISTLEDPVEYLLEGVNQIQINPRAKLDFASGLRALLRQDPDVIMVGEIRDPETATMAANAALTGHLLFTTLHTNDAASAFSRLLDMKVEDFVITGTVNLVIGQRLVRKICDNCAKTEKLNEAVVKKIKERKDFMDALEKKEKGLSESIQDKELRVGQGCEKCFQSGYSGRVGIFEFFVPNQKTQNLILNHESSETIETAAKKDGFEDMIADGAEKALQGITTFSEVLRVTRNA